MVPREEAYDFREKREGANTLFAKHFLKIALFFVLESKTKTDLSCSVGSHFFKSQGLYFAFLG